MALSTGLATSVSAGGKSAIGRGSAVASGVKMLGTISSGLGKEGKFGPAVSAGSKWAQPDRGFAKSIKAIAAKVPQKFGQEYRYGMPDSRSAPAKVGFLNSAAGEKAVQTRGVKGEGRIGSESTLAETRMTEMFGPRMGTPVRTQAETTDNSVFSKGKNVIKFETVSPVQKQMEPVQVNLPVINQGEKSSPLIRISSKTSGLPEVMSLNRNGEVRIGPKNVFRIDINNPSAVTNIDARFARARTERGQLTENLSEIIASRGRSRFDFGRIQGASLGLAEISRVSGPIKDAGFNPENLQAVAADSGRNVSVPVDAGRILNVNPVEFSQSIEILQPLVDAGVLNRDHAVLIAGGNLSVQSESGKTDNLRGKQKTLQGDPSANEIRNTHAGLADLIKISKDGVRVNFGRPASGIPEQLAGLSVGQQERVVEKVKSAPAGRQSDTEIIQTAVDEVKLEQLSQKIFESVDMLAQGRSDSVLENAVSGNLQVRIQSQAAELTAAVRTVNAMNDAGISAEDISEQVSTVLSGKGLLTREKAGLLVEQLLISIKSVNQEDQQPDEKDRKRVVFVEAPGEQNARVEVIQSGMGKLEESADGLFDSRDLAALMPDESNLPQIVSPIVKERLSDGSWKEIKRDTANLGRLTMDELANEMNRLVSEKPAVDVSEEAQTRAVGEEDVRRVLRQSVDGFIRRILHHQSSYRSERAA